MSSLLFPKKSHRKIITLPNKCNELAEFLGIVFGDGGIGNPWQLVITLNIEKDTDYIGYVAELISRLFDLKVRIWSRKTTKAVLIVCSSSTLVEYLHSIGVVKGNKIAQSFDIPTWIHDSASFEKAFVRGIVDTDGCLYTHRHIVGNHQYTNLGFCFASYSPKLLNSVAHIFAKNGIIPHICNKNRWICLYAKDAIGKYLEVFGSSNSRIYAKYNSW